MNAYPFDVSILTQCNDRDSSTINLSFTVRNTAGKHCRQIGFAEQMPETPNAEAYSLAISMHSAALSLQDINTLGAALGKALALELGKRRHRISPPQVQTEPAGVTWYCAFRDDLEQEGDVDFFTFAMTGLNLTVRQSSTFLECTCRFNRVRLGSDGNQLSFAHKTPICLNPIPTSNKATSLPYTAPAGFPFSNEMPTGTRSVNVPVTSTRPDTSKDENHSIRV